MKKKMYVEPSLQVVKMGAVVLQGGSPYGETIRFGGMQNSGDEVDVE